MHKKSRKYDLIIAASYIDENKTYEGKLKINKENIVFLAKSKTDRLKKVVIPIKDVVSIIKKTSLGFIPNVLILKTETNSYRFNVYSREQIIKYINEAKEA